MTTGEVARALHRSEDTVRRYADEGRLPSSRTEAGWRVFDPEAVAQFAQREQERRGAR